VVVEAVGEAGVFELLDVAFSRNVARLAVRVLPMTQDVD
jgi:hypothetical protein